jgi:hypothetical protein
MSGCWLLVARSKHLPGTKQPVTSTRIQFDPGAWS